MSYHTNFKGKLGQSYLFRDRVSRFLEGKYGKPKRQELPSGSTLITFFGTDEIDISTTECGDGYVFINAIGNTSQRKDLGKALKDKFGDKIKED